MPKISAPNLEKKIIIGGRTDGKKANPGNPSSGEGEVGMDEIRDLILGR